MSQNDNTGNISRNIVTARQKVVTNVIQSQDSMAPVTFKSPITTDVIRETTPGAGIIVCETHFQNGMIFNGDGSMLECQSHKNEPNGYAGLNSSGVLDSERLPFKHVNMNRAPTTADDINSDFVPGSRWLDTTNNEEWVCIKNTPSTAIWKQTTYVEYGEYGFEDIDNHLNDDTKHRVIDDAAGAGAVTKLWSADKLTSELVAKAAAIHTHLSEDITDWDAAVAAAPQVAANAVHAAITSGNPHAVTAADIGLGELENIKSNHHTSSPTTTNDASEGYSVGSHWFNTAVNKSYLCTNATPGAAVWKDITIREYDAVCSPYGDGDFTSIADAYDSGATSVFMRDGIYIESRDVNIPNGGKLVGETTSGCIITFLGQPYSVKCDATNGVCETAGTISVATGSHTVNGTGTTFTNISPGGNNYIKLDQNFYWVTHINSDAQVTLGEPYKGAPLIDRPYMLQQMYSGIVIENLIINGAGSNALFLRAVRSSIILGCAFMSSYSGICMADSSTNNILSVNCFNNYAYGLHLLNSYSIGISTSESYNNSVGFMVQGNSSNLVLSGILSSNNLVNGVEVTDTAQHMTLNDCVIQRNAQNGITTGPNTGSIIVDGCLCLYNGAMGVNCESNDNVVTSCLTSNNGLHGVKVGRSGVVCGNHIHSNGSHGIFLEDLDDCQIMSNTIHDNDGDGISITGSRNTCSGNSIRNNTGEGICIIGSNDCILVDNLITGNGLHGICIEEHPDTHVGSCSTLVTNNRIIGNDVGIFVRENCNCALLDGNLITGAGGHGIHIIGDECTITNNICNGSAGDDCLIDAASDTIVKTNRFPNYNDQGTNTVNDLSINDSIAVATDTWSSLKITNELASKSNLAHTHTASQITDWDAAVAAAPQVAANTTHAAASGNPHSVTAADIGLDNVVNTKVNLVAITAPTDSDDSSEGYSKGSLWVDATNNHAYVCMNATVGSAIWKDITVTDHDALSATGTYTHAQLDAHLNDDTKHRVIDDGLTSATNMWSAQKISGDLAGKAAVVHTHTSSQITDWTTAVDARITAQKGQNNGLATLNPQGKVPADQLELDTVSYQGSWNATTNVPTIVSGVGTQGHYYVVGVAGVTDIDGITDWQPSDWIIFNGSVWEKADHSDSVTSVAGKQGNVVLDHEDISDWDASITANVDVAANTAHRSNTSNPHGVTKAQIGLDKVINIKHKVDGVGSPTNGDDVNNGYTAGSLWIDLVGNRAYVCVDEAAGAAVWKLATHLNTDDLSEGSSNLYWNNSRFDTRLATKDTDDLSEGSSNLYWTDSRFDMRLAAKTTDDVSEGSNLYYTDTRFDTRLAAKDTDNVSEGSSNLYWTNTRFDTRLGTKTTDDVSEGSNLYYTESRVDANTNVAANSAHRVATGNPHSVTAAEVGSATAQWNADKLQGKPVSDVVPLDNQVLIYNGTEYKPEHIFDETAKTILYDDFTGRCIAGSWAVQTSGNATINPIDGIGGQVQLVSGTLANEFAAISSGLMIAKNSANCEVSIRIKLDSDINTIVNVGLRSDDNNLVDFQYNAGGAASTWVARSVNAGSATSENAIAGDTDWHIFRIVTTSSSVKFYIDNVLHATISTNIYTGLMRVECRQTSKLNAARTLKLDYIKVVCDREENNGGLGGGECVIL